MRFKIISTGWQCADWLEQTLESVQTQTRTDWDLMVVYDKSTDNGAEKIKKWCERGNLHGKAWYELNDEQYFACRNQYIGLKLLAPDDDDIIIFLDLDGDKLAHPTVLQHVADAYDDPDMEVLVTYGNYKPVPDPGTTETVRPFPDYVVATNGYRDFILSPQRATSFNHLRTMKGKVFNSLPESHFKFLDGRWYTIGTDYIFMLAALERAAGRYKCIEEILLLYNHDNPNADFRLNPGEDCVQDMLHRPPLEPLPYAAN